MMIISLVNCSKEENLLKNNHENRLQRTKKKSKTLQFWSFSMMSFPKQMKFVNYREIKRESST